MLWQISILKRIKSINIKNEYNNGSEKYHSWKYIKEEQTLLGACILQTRLCWRCVVVKEDDGALFCQKCFWSKYKHKKILIF